MEEKGPKKINIEAEKHLIQRCITGEKTGWDEFVKQYTKLIYNSIYRTLELKGYSTEGNIVEDLHQEVFLSLVKDDFRKLKTFKGGNSWGKSCSLARWLYVVTGNLVLNFIRSNYKNKSLTQSLDEKIDENEDKTLLDTIEDEAPSVREMLGKEEMMIILNKCLEKLDITERVILDMFYLQGLPLEEIARVLAKSQDAIFMQKKRVIEKIREMLKKDVGF